MYDCFVVYIALAEPILLVWLVYPYIHYNFQKVGVAVLAMSGGSCRDYMRHNSWPNHCIMGI